ncbi:MAG: peptidylprolyl isomerase [Opitutales bacterium]|nr:peptidylprolyl isomerase [Opitutales bacterium]NRA27144.1 peptidylprolyl isomerase [Opitutales bacterium]
MAKTQIKIETNHGTFTVALFEDIAPKTCENFTTHAKNGYYDGLIFHRIIKEFMLQGGDPTGTGMGGESIWGKPFEDEVDPNVKFDRKYLLAMANAGPNTNGSQFFVTTIECPWLNMRHTIFGEVTEGSDVIDAIEAVDTDPRDKPRKPVKIEKATVL